MTTASALPDQLSIDSFRAAGPDAIEAGNAWLAAFRQETGRAEVTVGGETIPLPEAVGDDIEGRLDDPLLVGCALWGAALVDGDAARMVQSALEDAGGRGVATIVAAAVAAVGSIVGGALGLSSASKTAKAAKDSAKAAQLNLEATRLAAAAEIEAAEQKTRQTTILICGLGVTILLAMAIWSRRQ